MATQNFMVRIQLHDPGADYGKVHKAMESAGFHRQIRMSGQDYHLPHAEYFGHFNDDVDGVHSKAATAVVTALQHLDFDIVTLKFTGIRKLLRTVEPKPQPPKRTRQQLIESLQKMIFEANEKRNLGK